LVDIGQQDGVMLPGTAAALVGAGVLSVLVYPLIAVTLHRSAPLTPADVGIPATESAAGTSASPETPDQGSGAAAAGEPARPRLVPRVPAGRPGSPVRMDR